MNWPLALRQEVGHYLEYVLSFGMRQQLAG
jgi:hypothetical protein